MGVDKKEAEFLKDLAKASKELAKAGVAKSGEFEQSWKKAADILSQHMWIDGTDSNAPPDKGFSHSALAQKAVNDIARLSNALKAGMTENVNTNKDQLANHMFEDVKYIAYLKHGDHNKDGSKVASAQAKGQNAGR